MRLGVRAPAFRTGDDTDGGNRISRCRLRMCSF